jgi:hypothetical protein
MVVEAHAYAMLNNKYAAEFVKEVMLVHAGALERQGDLVRAAAIKRWCDPCVNLQSVCNMVKRYRKEKDFPKVSQTGPKLAPFAAAHKEAFAFLASMAAGGSPSTSAAATVGGEGGSSRQPQKQPQKQPRGAPKANRRRKEEDRKNMSEYELMRLKNIRRNQGILKQLGLDGAPPGGRDKGKAAADTAPAPQQPTQKLSETHSASPHRSRTPEGQLYTDEQLENPSSSRSSSQELDDEQRLAAIEFAEDDDARMLAAIASAAPELAAATRVDNDPPGRWPMR